jgi:hypothetical protein
MPPPPNRNNRGPPPNFAASGWSDDDESESNLSQVSERYEQRNGNHQDQQHLDFRNSLRELEAANQRRLEQAQQERRRARPPYPVTSDDEEGYQSEATVVHHHPQRQRHPSSPPPFPFARSSSPQPRPRPFVPPGYEQTGRFYPGHDVEGPYRLDPHMRQGDLTSGRDDDPFEQDRLEGSGDFAPGRRFGAYGSGGVHFPQQR